MPLGAGSATLRSAACLCVTAEAEQSIPRAQTPWTNTATSPHSSHPPYVHLPSSVR